MSFFITFEGIEGSGKTTQLQRLRQHLESLGHRVVATREPGGCPIADRLRALLLDPGNAALTPRAELLLYGAARAQHVAEVIRPALEAGRIVLCDRFSDATRVYQGHGRGLDDDDLAGIDAFAAGGLKPDLTLLLDYPVDAGLGRARQRNRDAGQQAAEGRFELESLDFHRRVRAGYLALADGDERFRVIDATGDVARVADRVRAAVDDFLHRRRSA